MIENIYGVYSGSLDDPTFVYVGKTSGSVDERFQNHIRAARAGIDPKPLYELLRFDEAAYSVVLLDTTANGLSEADYVRTLSTEHNLVNANGGNRAAAKARDTTKERETQALLRGKLSASTDSRKAYDLMMKLHREWLEKNTDETKPRAVWTEPTEHSYARGVLEALAEKSKYAQASAPSGDVVM